MLARRGIREYFAFRAHFCAREQPTDLRRLFQGNAIAR